MLDFSPIICEMQGWSQGWLGIALTVAGLTLAVALMVYLRWYMGLAYVFLGALALYYGWPILEDWFHIQLDCPVVQSQFAQYEHYQQNTATCENNLLTVASQTGEDCSCNGQSATPQCVTYESACQSGLGGYQTSYNACSCSTTNNVNGTATPNCQVLAQQANYSQFVVGGNGFSLNSSNGQVCVSLNSGNGANANLAPYYASCMSTANGQFNGFVNITGTAQVGYNCGGNSGFAGQGNEIVPVNNPPTTCASGGQGVMSSNGALLPANTQIGTGQPIVYSGGTFSGGPIIDYYASSTGKLMTFELTPHGSCVEESLNGAATGEFCG